MDMNDDGSDAAWFQLEQELHQQLEESQWPFAS